MWCAFDGPALTGGGVRVHELQLFVFDVRVHVALPRRHVVRHNVMLGAGSPQSKPLVVTNTMLSSYLILSCVIQVDSQHRSKFLDVMCMYIHIYIYCYHFVFTRLLNCHPG